MNYKLILSMTVLLSGAFSTLNGVKESGGGAGPSGEDTTATIAAVAQTQQNNNAAAPVKKKKRVQKPVYATDAGMFTPSVPTGYIWVDVDDEEENDTKANGNKQKPSGCCVQ